MNTADRYHPWLHRFAVATAALALLPIVIGALVTTLDAGMAFPDWPTSDGHNMFLYPWLKSAGDKFAEHAHRLAGALIGLVSIGLVAVAWRTEPRRWVRWACAGVLGCVVVQGLLGGLRVIEDERVLALVHGNFAAWVFSLMAAVALFTSRSWFAAAARNDYDVGSLKPWALVTALLILLQSVMGGLLRHLGTALHSHLGFAVLVLVFVVVTVVSAHRSRIAWLRRPAYLLALLIVVQIALGAGAWINKYGFPSTGYVALQGSAPQVWFRTAHAVAGMLLFMTSVNYALRVFRLDHLAGVHRQRVPSVRVQMGGGVQCQA